VFNFFLCVNSWLKEKQETRMIDMKSILFICRINKMIYFIIQG
jgi:hypothetical protein